MSSPVRDDLARKRDTFNTRYTKIIDGWIESISPQYPDVSQGDWKQVESDLWEYLNTLFLAHGVESLSFITETETAPPVNIDAVEVPAVVRSDNLATVEKIEFPRFLGSDDPDVIRLLLDLIGKAIRYLSTVVDPEVLASLRGKLRGKILFLDSNAVYRLVNLQGPHRHEVMTSVVNLCKDAGFDLRVNRVTMDELRRRLHFDAGVLRKFPVPTNLAAVGVHYLTDENYVSTYWQAARTERISAEDFISHYSHIDDLLEELGVTVEATARELSPRSQDKVTYWVSKLAGMEDANAGYSKSMASLEHDAYNVALIDELAAEAEHFSDTPALFLTTDRALVRLQRFHHEREGRVPFCIMPSQLLQILRFATPADGAYDKAFLGLFSRSFVPSGIGLPPEMVQEILARVAKYKATPKLADKVLSDTLFVRRYKGTMDDSERDDIVHDAVVAKAKELEEALADNQARLASTEHQTAELQQAVALHESAAKELERRVQDQESMHQQREATLQGQVEAMQAQLQAAEEAKAALEAERSRAEAARVAAEERERVHIQQEEELREQTRKRWQGGAVLVVLCLPLASVLVLHLWGTLGKTPKAAVLPCPLSA